jgi:hypothetical protein
MWLLAIPSRAPRDAVDEVVLLAGRSVQPERLELRDELGRRHTCRITPLITGPRRTTLTLEPAEPAAPVQRIVRHLRHQLRNFFLCVPSHFEIWFRGHELL